MDLEQQVEAANYRAERQVEQTQLQLEVAERMRETEMRTYKAEIQARVIK